MNPQADARHAPVATSKLAPNPASTEAMVPETRHRQAGGARPPLFSLSPSNPRRTATCPQTTLPALITFAFCGTVASRDRTISRRARISCLLAAWPTSRHKRLANVVPCFVESFPKHQEIAVSEFDKFVSN